LYINIYQIRFLHLFFNIYRYFLISNDLSFVVFPFDGMRCCASDNWQPPVHFSMFQQDNPSNEESESDTFRLMAI